MQNLNKPLAILLSLSLLAGLPVMAQEQPDPESVPALAQSQKQDTVFEVQDTDEDGLSEKDRQFLAQYLKQDPAVLGSLGFLISQNDWKGAAVLAAGLANGDVRLFDSSDPMTLEHFMQALDYIDTCNQLRARHKLPALKVSLTLMAISAVQTGYARGAVNHSQYYPVGENLAWGQIPGAPLGKGNPFDAWYTWEKALYEKSGDKAAAGHYFNIIDESYTMTGFSVASTSRTGYGPVFGQVFSSWDVYGPEKSLLTTAQVREKLKAYQTHLYDGTLEPKLPDGQTAMYRLYNPNSGEHFYTKSREERNSLIHVGWNYEGYGWIAPVKGTPVYRLYNPNAGDHHYTKNKAERDHLLKVGWKDEGTGWYSNEDGKQKTPLYRQYNPNASSGTHNYTTNKNENDQLVKAGWKSEGIGWYGC